MPDPDKTNGSPQRSALPLHQNLTGAAVMIAPHLPTMENVGQVRTVLKSSELPLMDATAPVHEQGGAFMSGAPPGSGAAPQQPKQSQTTALAEGYVRLEIHYEAYHLSVIGAKEVAGPLISPTSVIHGMAYEVLIDGQQVTLGSIPDVGVRRAFANRDVPGREGKHYFIKEQSFNFYVRMPMVHVTAASLPKVTVVLHNVEETPDRLANIVPLQQQRGVKTEEIARLPGIRVEQLPPTVRPVFEQLMNENRLKP